MGGVLEKTSPPDPTLTGSGGPNSVDPAILEKVVVGGDLSSLTAGQRLAWYNARCAAAGLDPRTQPFAYLVLGGKCVLYATKTATDQLIARHRLKVEILDRRTDKDTYIFEVLTRVTFPDGHSVEDVGTLYVGGLKGVDLANAIMKVVTKSKRRTVLSACGLGMLDETEVETISGSTYGTEPTVTGEAPKNDSGHGRGQYASPEQAKAYADAIGEWIDKRNAQWLDGWQQRDGSFPPGCKDLLNTWQANGHLLKWGVETGRLDKEIIPENAKTRQAANYPAIIYHRSTADRKALAKEMSRYADEQAGRMTESIYKRSPELRPDDAVIDAVIDEDPADDLDDFARQLDEGRDRDPGSDG